MKRCPVTEGDAMRWLTRDMENEECEIDAGNDNVRVFCGAFNPTSEVLLRVSLTPLSDAGTLALVPDMLVNQPTNESHEVPQFHIF